MSTIRVAVAFSLHLMTRKPSAAHTKDFCEKNLPKLPNFEGKICEIYCIQNSFQWVVKI